MEKNADSASPNRWHKCKIVSFSIAAALCTILFFVSISIDYQQELLKEHVRFRKNFVSQRLWQEDSNNGRLYYYLFNVTNSQEFLRGEDKRLHLQEVGPIVYRLRIISEILGQDDDTVTFNKVRYRYLEFDPERSVSPDILNQTIIMPNIVLLSVAAALHNWVYFVRHAFNAVTITEKVFLNKTIYYFLWEFDVPALRMLSTYVPNIMSNCGLLHQVSKLVSLALSGVLCTILFVLSLCISYQHQVLREHVRFRSGMLSQKNWIPTPAGQLRIYLFNVTNSVEFLSGQDERIQLEEIGPIVYHLSGLNEIQHQDDDELTYRKIRNHIIEFDPEASCAPDILNQTIIMPNLVLLGAAAKLHDWVFLVRHAFNAITINEPVFLNKSVYYFLWDFNVPALQLLANYVPNIVSNCGLLHNALRSRDEVYNVKIGNKNGFENFFHIQTLNNLTYFPEQRNILRYANGKHCPVEVVDAFDNSLFPPNLQPDQDLRIVAVEICRTLKLYYDGPAEYLGFQGYRYVLGERNEEPSCLDTSMGIKLHSGMYDVSKCLINDVPSAFSAPHFLDSSYNYSEHFVGISPDRERHEARIILEPTTGTPLMEKYRFQSNIPMPDMQGYNADLQKLSHMVVPSFWYEYDLEEYPSGVMFLLRMNVHHLPIIQPILIVIFFFVALFSYLKIYLLLKHQTFKEVYTKYWTLLKELRPKKK